jgi:hypothetical protein
VHGALVKERLAFATGCGGNTVPMALPAEPPAARSSGGDEQKKEKAFHKIEVTDDAVRSMRSRRAVEKR